MSDLDLTTPPRRQRSVPPVVVTVMPWIAALVLTAALVVFLVQRWNSSSTPPPPPPAKAAPKPGAKVPAAKLDTAGRLVAGRFILTAVSRQNLAEAWNLASPNLRQGITHAAWLAGNLPVVPFEGPIGSAPLHIVYVHPRDALLEVALFPAKGSKTNPGDFFLALVKVGKGSKAHWAVDSWVPRAAPAVPLRTAG
jgi:hypothetical protein